MTIQTVTVEDLTKVDFNSDRNNPYFYASEKYAWVRNKSGAVMYASRSEDVGAGVLGSAEIPAGGFVRLELDGTNVIYLSGSGDAEIQTTNTAVSPFKRAAKGGGNSDGTNFTSDILIIDGVLADTIIGEVATNE